MNMPFMLTLLSLLPVVLVAGTAWSHQISLQPPECMIELRSYGFGLIPFDGKFSRFHGAMRYDSPRLDACEVELQIEAASLMMSSIPVRDHVTGPDMMDVACYPDLAFVGTLQGRAVVGNLTMHGQTKPVTLDLTRRSGTLVATGHLRRAEWGIVGSPLTGGLMIRIRVVIPDPFSPPYA